MISSEPWAALSAVSAVLDLANGLANDKSVLTGLFAFALAREVGASDVEARAAFLAGLLRHLGCTAFAASEVALDEDDIGLRGRLLRVDAARKVEVLRALDAGRSGIADRLAGAMHAAFHARELQAAWTGEACGAARWLARQLALGAAVEQAMDEVFERWDGLGGPRGVAGEEISLVGRLAACAHCAILFLLDGDLQDAQQVLAVRSGAVLDPVLGRRAGALLGPFAAAPVEEQALAAERVLQAEPLPLDLLTLARTFGDFADLQLPFARGHSRRVAEACERAAAALGLPAEERRDLLLAAHLHDIGQIAVPTGCWLRPRWSPADRQRAQAHASFTEQVLRASAPLAGAARIAGAHHELLDGSGYPRGRRGPFLDAAARILATSDVLCALREPRPHRAAMSREQAASVLQEEGRARRLDAGVIEALLDGRGGSRARPAEAPRLTPRELEVVRLLARGRTNKEIAVALGISARTVQHHTLHIYEKFGVDTRAAATLQALHLGLLEGVDDR